MVLVEGQIVGWMVVPYRARLAWAALGQRRVQRLCPYRRRGYATRAVRLPVGLLRDHTDHERAKLVIDHRRWVQLAAPIRRGR
jgi:hypothetical protein